MDHMLTDQEVRNVLAVAPRSEMSLATKELIADIYRRIADLQRELAALRDAS